MDNGMDNRDSTDILHRVHRIHFVGIGGSGMSPLAEILHTRGYALSGSDNNESDNVARMRSLGIPVSMGHDAKNIEGAELVVYTAAVNAQNPELAAAREKGIPLLERAKLLGLITRRYPNTVAVAGTHGKTTTTSMIAQILLQAGLDPTLFIGGRLPLIGANGRAGASDTMVCEACEFQDHYLEMRPAISVILNIDADHLDYFGTLDNVIASFRKFARQTTGTLIVNMDDENAPKAVQGLEQEGKAVVTYGLDNENWDWTAKQVGAVSGCYGVYDLYHKGQFLAHVQLGVPGAHNVSNSLAAAAAASLCGATPQQIVEGLDSFHGAGRRFEFLGTVDGITIADDYAHHPTEISATLSAAKGMGYQRVWAVFQPFTFSRTARHLDGFVSSLSVADKVIVSDIMGSREENTWNVSSEQITSRIPGALYLPAFPEIADYVTAHVRPGDLVLTMGGGDVYKCARMIKERLEKKQSAQV